MNGQIDWTKPVQILTSVRWVEYLFDVDTFTLSKFKFKVKRHFGIPIDYPCLVITIIDSSNQTAEHKFIYIQEAYELIKLARQMESRFVRAIIV